MSGIIQRNFNYRVKTLFFCFKYTSTKVHEIGFVSKLKKPFWIAFIFKKMKIEFKFYLPYRKHVFSENHRRKNHKALKDY